jgi:hypothetical protein
MLKLNLLWVLNNNPNIIYIVFLPPSRPSPTGEGVQIKHFPLGGNRKGGYIENITQY